MSYFGDDDDYNSSEYNESGSDSEDEKNVRDNKKKTMIKNNKTPLSLPITDDNDNEVDIELSDEDEDDIEDEAEEQYGGVADYDYEEEEDEVVVNKKKIKTLEEDEEGEEEGEEEEYDNEEEPIYENETKQIKQIAQKLIQDIDSGNEEEDDEDGEIYLKKFNEDIHKNYILNFHPESTLQNYDEIMALTKVVRDKNNIVVDTLHRTIPYLTKYERTRILGQRAKQINSGATPFVKVPENVIDGYLIAELELQQKRIPFIIRRPLPNGGSEYWCVKDLENIAF